MDGWSSSLSKGNWLVHYDPFLLFLSWFTNVHFSVIFQSIVRVVYIHRQKIFFHSSRYQHSAWGIPSRAEKLRGKNRNKKVGIFLHDLQFVNAGRGCKRRPYGDILQCRFHDCLVASNECLLFTQFCCGECIYYS